MTYCPVADTGSTLDHPKRRRSLSAQSPRRQSPGRRKPSTWVAAPDLLVPRPPQPLVLRPRLFEVLDRGIGAPLTLGSAPAGFGTTALLASWLVAYEVRVLVGFQTPLLGQTALAVVVAAGGALCVVRAWRSGSGSSLATQACSAMFRRRVIIGYQVACGSHQSANHAHQ